MKPSKALWIALAVTIALLRAGWYFYVVRQGFRTRGPVSSAGAGEPMRTTAMTPTIRVGENVMVEKNQRVRHGDIVMLAEPFANDAIVLRIVGTAGDKIEIRNKQLFVNDVMLIESYAVHDDAEIRPREQDAQRDQFGPVVVGVDRYFVLGDNRDHANDSRYFGTVPAKNVKGPIRFVSGLGGWRRVHE